MIARFKCCLLGAAQSSLNDGNGQVTLGPKPDR
jgi:hypothetical protein